jgi:transcriptional regulator
VYVPSVDRPLSGAEWRAFVAAQGFGHLIAGGVDREVPVVTPTQFVMDGDEVLAHVAAANPILAALAERPRALLSVAGDWAFIPSSWKAIREEDPERGIPTTYYAAVQLSGPVEVASEPDAIAAVLRRQLAALQPDVAVADPEEAHPKKLQAIRAITIRVERVESKFKYGGNVDEEHRRAIVDRLAERSAPGDAAALEHAMQRVSSVTDLGSAFRRP